MAKTTIETALRRVWLYYDEERKAVLMRCRLATDVYSCEECKGECKRLAIHHIHPVATIAQGASIQEVCKTLFVPRRELRGLCKECHRRAHEIPISICTQAEF